MATMAGAVSKAQDLGVMVTGPGENRAGGTESVGCGRAGEHRQGRERLLLARAEKSLFLFANSSLLPLVFFKE